MGTNVIAFIVISVNSEVTMDTRAKSIQNEKGQLFKEMSSLPIRHSAFSLNT